RQRGSGTQVMMRVGGGGPGGGSPPPPSLAPPTEPTDWPELKPPFTSGAAVVAPDGSLWVLRTREAKDPVPTYDVFDSFGARVGKVVLPREARLVGFGRTSVYLVRRDADDLEYLQRFAL
ncbi:MAG TPA: hypothetical protein VFY16_05945, partial [Gemmatimonadaceae bacterium]|nr:hypothetical protein [Gemmatimonadaceae bacterium]